MPVDKTLDGIGAKCNCEIVAGPPKSNQRLLEKATLSYGGNLRRVTDFERRTVLCDGFADMCEVRGAHALRAVF